MGGDAGVPFVQVAELKRVTLRAMEIRQVGPDFAVEGTVDDVYGDR